MCMQCMAAAMGSTAAATGTRSYIAARHFSWLTPSRMRRITIGLLSASVIASTMLVSGSSAPPSPVHHATSVYAAR